MRDRKKLLIRYKTRALYKEGKIQKVKCLHCPATDKLEFHHTDYNSPMSFIILCSACHKAVHREMRRALQEEHK